MNSNYINTEGVQSVISNFDDKTLKIESLFERVNNNINLINGTDVWDGELNMAFIKKYSELSSNYEEIISSLKYLSLFMKDVVSKNKKYESNIQNDINTNESNLNVNS